MNTVPILGEVTWREWLMALPTPWVVAVGVWIAAKATLATWPGVATSEYGTLIVVVVTAALAAAPIASGASLIVLGRRLAKVVPGYSCPNCGYDMTTHSEPTGSRCPECGKFVVAAVHFRGERHRALQAWALVHLIVALLGFGLLGAGLLIYLSMR